MTDAGTIVTNPCPKNLSIQYIKCIGKGSYGEVWSAKWEDRLVAAKKLDEKYFNRDYDQEIKERYMGELKRESHVLQTLIHPNILRMYTMLFPFDQSPVIITELLHCDLRKFIETSKTVPKVVPNTLKTVSLGIAEGLVYLHGLQSPVVHRDISTKNILLTEDQQPKIADLGVAKVFKTNRDEYATSNPGTPVYSAPETIGNDFHALKYGVKADIFSFGVVMMAMINGREPLVSQKAPSKGSKIPEKERRKEDVDAMGDHPLKPLVLECLNDKASKRPTAKEIIKNLGTIHTKSDTALQAESQIKTNNAPDHQQSEITSRDCTRSHFEKIPTQHGYDYRFKILLIGNSGVGKTCLVQKLRNPEYNHILSVSTIGIEPYRQAFQYNSKTVELQITDTAGQEQFFSIQPSYFRQIEGMFLVYDVLSEITFKKLPDWIDFAKQYFSKSCVHVVVVGNKVDCKEIGKKAKRAISREEGQAFADSLGYPYVETSVTPGYAHTIMNMYEKMVEILVQTAAPECVDVNVKDTKNNAFRVDESSQSRFKCPC